MRQKKGKDITRYFEKQLKKYGNSPRAVGWINEKTQGMRFKVLSEIANLEHQRILDVGCGLGHFYGYLKKKVAHFDYLGVDISYRMIATAKIIYPDAKFEVMDIMKKNPAGSFDYIFSSGIDNYETGHNDVFICQIMKRMFKFAEKGVSINMLSTLFSSSSSDGLVHYFDPIYILKYCSRVTSWVVLRHDYLNNDFTVYLYKYSPHRQSVDPFLHFK